MNPTIPRDLQELAALIREGEGRELEFKRSTGELREAMQTLCAFLNCAGGSVIVGVRPDGRIEGQQVSDQTLREIAEAAGRFEPPADVCIERLRVDPGHDVIVLGVESRPDVLPATYDGRPYERVGSTTRKMPQAKYERLLLSRAHGRRRWENELAPDTSLRDLDRAEIHRIVEAARAAGRLVSPVGRGVTEILDRLGVRRDGKLLQAAIVLFGKRFLPDYPQCELRLARFRGRDKAEFLDQKQLKGSAFKLLEEALVFCQRHLPLPGLVEPGRPERVDRPLIPPDALREILVNALIHRDYAIAGGAVSLAIFDDRLEIWSTGTFPVGITPRMLARSHPSLPRNPIIAEVFHRAGLIERWGRGTNRVIEMCRAASIQPPEFAQIGGAAVVTFRVPVGSTAGTPQVAPHETPQVTPQVALLLHAARTPQSREQLQRATGIADREHFRRAYVLPLLSCGWLERTMPDRPRSRLQRYRTTTAGLAALKRTPTE